MTTVSQALNAVHPLASLVQDPEQMHVGYVIKMSYSEVTILTNDFWKRRSGHVPRNSFLVATSFDPANFDKSESDDRVVVLLRAREEASLPNDLDTLNAIVEHYQRKTEVQRTDEFDGIEKITHARLQFKGLTCHILGAFYTDANGILNMGSDVEDFYAMAQLRVYKPTPDALERIVNFIAPVREQKARKDAQQLLRALPDRIHIGHVRYTSTIPTQAEQIPVPVSIQPMDFLGRRTAVFGMTRTGKSNTVKSTVAAVSLVAKKAGVKVGQVIFDVKGEYANANHQDDGSSLAEALGDDVIRYGAHGREGFEDLRDNFYDSLNAGLQMLQSAVRLESTSLPNDYLFLLNLSLDKPSEKNEIVRWERNCAIYRCLLYAAGFSPGDNNKNVYFELNPNVFRALHQRMFEDNNSACSEVGCTNSDMRSAHVIDMLAKDYHAIIEDGTFRGLPLEHAVAFWSTLRDMDRELVKAGSVGLESSSSPKNNPKPWLDDTSRTLLNIMQGRNNLGTSYRSPNFLKSTAGKHHSPKGLQDVAKRVYEQLSEGKVVILDLSAGNEAMKTTKSERIARYIFDHNMESFSITESKGEQKPVPIVMMYIEEAHNLIGKNDKIESTWPKIAKEGAAFRIGMMYSTQEPSSVHPYILAETENFFVTHLSNDSEIKTLSQYYDFKDFAEAIKQADDVGFSRIKTLSAHFVVPTQILEFKPLPVQKALAEIVAKSNGKNVRT